MSTMIHFTKMHGAGNDYIYVDTDKCPIADPVAAAIAWSRSHTGIGSDGLVLIGRSQIPEADLPATSQLTLGHQQASLHGSRSIADFTMRIFNADGSEAMMCGNASRCIGKYVYEKGLTDKTEIRLLTLSGVKVLGLHIRDGKVESVTVDMGTPALANEKQFAPCETALPEGCFVCMGNPHYVIFVDDINSVDVAGKGSLLEHHSAFPERANIEFAEMRPDGIRMRVWERGSGITMACGTGACATAVAAYKTGRAGRQSHIIMDGGALDIEWRKADNHIYMTGPAEFVFEGDIELSK